MMCVHNKRDIDLFYFTPEIIYFQQIFIKYFFIFEFGFRLAASVAAIKVFAIFIVDVLFFIAFSLGCT